MRRLWCALWGHRLFALRPLQRRKDDAFDVACRRCGAIVFADELPYMSLPWHWRKHHFGPETKDMCGPLRRFIEVYRCLFFGHDDEWEPFLAKFSERLVCATCGEERPETEIESESRWRSRVE